MEKKEYELSQIIDEMRDEIASIATEEEAELYCKVFESGDKDVFEFFGQTKEEILGMFIEVWTVRYISEQHENI
mgnify:CR=1 FL=1